ncbi:hypothetical protein [Bacteroidetes bacterium endosymbiont of Geopemphigus sp.]|uniref:hypothetical protein n=1 Tax=Bacteroidetes bacterium endosymbiont of Geopemphigus sp. TaxID=2047937 RepID=UPI0011AEE070|nr:hypothetical protein [Bacteroidetes bacterium endosymbiont of Geopemphigus sp.]
MNEKLNKIELKNKTKLAIIDLIDEKVESDMEKVLNRIDMLSSEFKTENQSLKNEIKIMYWVIGISIAIIGLRIALKS